MIGITRVLQIILTALNLPLRDQLWFCLLIPYSGLIRLAVLLIPFRVISPHLGNYYKNIELSTTPSKGEQLLALRIGRAVQLTARYTPWESKCLVQAIMAKTLLAYYDVDYVLHLGVKKGNTDEPLKAHAWVTVGSSVLTGRSGHKAYRIVATYSAVQE